jgi:hypothetical protein
MIEKFKKSTKAWNEYIKRTFEFNEWIKSTKNNKLHNIDA